eukprot:3763526-Karenia_brevis.AAC.1
MSLWNDLPNYAKRKRKAHSMKSEAAKQAELNNRCMELCREGSYSLSCKTLTKAPPLEPTHDARTQLQEKHPRAQAPDLSLLGRAPRGLVPAVDTASVA